MVHTSLHGISIYAMKPERNMFDSPMELSLQVYLASHEEVIRDSVSFADGLPTLVDTCAIANLFPPPFPRLN